MRRKDGPYSIAMKEHECLYCRDKIPVGELYKCSNSRTYHRTCWESRLKTGDERFVQLLMERGPMFSDELMKEYGTYSSHYRTARARGVAVYKLTWSKGKGRARGPCRRFVLYYLEEHKHRALIRLRERGHSSTGKFVKSVLG